ncbi:MAG: hypothetical protein KIT09_15950 [Bryobacteraceae bacterium]|nr:hypothetical protein [Bryobacteraceae bacterium]
MLRPKRTAPIELLNQALADGELNRRLLYIWSVSRGLCTTDFKPVDRKTADPRRIIPFLLESDKPGVFVLEDFHFFLDEGSQSASLAIRELRDLVGPFKAARKTVVQGRSPCLRTRSTAAWQAPCSAAAWLTR